MRNLSLTIAVAMALGVPSPSGKQSALAQREPLTTIAEDSQFQATCTSQECDSFVTKCAASGAHVTKLSFGRTVDDRDLVAAVMAHPAATIATRDERLRILVIGNIHSGECAGKEALLMLLREIGAAEDHPWMKEAVLVFVPNYNADANDKQALDNRPGQLGPVRGMGRRENSQGYDLNRDFVKVESPEATALIRLMNDFDPHLFIDCHTTNGSQHRYALTYDIPHNPATPAAIRDYLRQQMMPRITAVLEQQGTATFFYGNLDRDNSRWTTYGYEPRYSTEYFGLRGRLAILSEAYSYISYRDRIFATKAFVTECVNDAIANAGAVKTLLAGVDAAQLDQTNNSARPQTLSLAAELAAFPSTVSIKGYKDDKPFDFDCRFYGDFRSTRDTTLPVGYLVPKRLTKVTDLLQRHGIRMSQLQEPREGTVEIDAIDTINRATRPFQGHFLQSIMVTRRRETQAIPQGTWLVRTNQPLGRLAAYILESESTDGVVTWNYIDEHLKEGVDYPIVRLVE